MYVGQAFASDHNMRFVETAVFFRCIVSCHSINIFVLHGTRKSTVSSVLEQTEA